MTNQNRSNWTCPACEENIEPQFDVCWSCGQAKPGIDEQTPDRPPVELWQSPEDGRRYLWVTERPQADCPTFADALHLGVVVGKGQQVPHLGAGISNFADVLRGKGVQLESLHDMALNEAIVQLFEQAAILEANLITEISLDWSQSNLLEATLSGLAWHTKLEPDETAIDQVNE